MKSYIYVVAYYANKQDQEENLISFQHVFVAAEDVNTAYDIGHEKIDQPCLLNDYVALAEKPKKEVKTKKVKK